MSTINDRICMLRRSLKLTQTEFGERIGVKIGVIRNFEYNVTTPSDEQIKLMSRVYYVNEEWLRTGKGEMFREKDNNEYLAIMVADALESKTPESKTKMRILLALSKLSRDQWFMLDRFIMHFSEFVQFAMPRNNVDIISNVDSDLSKFFSNLNTAGRAEAVKRIEELTQIPKYTTPDKPNKEDT